MAVEYLACGNIMTDQIEDKNGKLSAPKMGGPAFYALAGIRLWTPNCKLVCKAGADYADTYGVWMQQNRVPQDSVNVVCEHCTCHVLTYQPDGSFLFRSKYGQEVLGYMKTHPEDIDVACANQQVKGMYMAQNTDKIVWDKLAAVKKKYGFKIMWELEHAPGMREKNNWSRQEMQQRILHCLQVADMWSLNHNEAADLFGIPREDDKAMIAQLQKLPVEMTFYRVGSRGAFVVTPTNSYFCQVIKPFGESADPTGCGNNSTGTAMYSWAAGDDGASVAVKACISAGFNAAQNGPYPLYTEEDTHLAEQLLREYLPKVRAI